MNASLTMRRYRGEDDYWRIRSFLREVFLRNNRRDHSWLVQRFDYYRWHVNENILKLRFENVIFLWEAPDDRIAAVLNPEGLGEAFLQIHPDYRTEALESAMIAVAGEHLAEIGADGKRSLQIWAHAGDLFRRRLLSAQGYTRGDWPEFQRCRVLDGPIAVVSPPSGYVIRALGDSDELPRRSWVSWRAFHPDEPNERYEGWTWYANVQRIPLYRRDLDIIAVAPDGSFAAFCTIWYDDVTRTGYLEPVGVAPEHQRRGLGKAVILEGLRRLHQLGGNLAMIGGYSEAANALYSSTLSSDYILFERWCKTW